MPKIVQKELSYKIVGFLFEVHRQLGNRYKEKYYQRALEIEFKKNNIFFKREFQVDLKYNDENIGKYFIDFLIEGKVVLEIKAVPRFRPVDFKQVMAYLKANNLELGIIANFRPESLEYKRILNSSFIRSKNSYEFG